MSVESVVVARKSSGKSSYDVTIQTNVLSNSTIKVLSKNKEVEYNEDSFTKDFKETTENLQSFQRTVPYNEQTTVTVRYVLNVQHFDKIKAN